MTKTIGITRKEAQCYILFDSQSSHKITPSFLMLTNPDTFTNRHLLILSRELVNDFSLVFTEQGTDSIPSAYNCL